MSEAPPPYSAHDDKSGYPQPGPAYSAPGAQYPPPNYSQPQYTKQQPQPVVAVAQPQASAAVIITTPVAPFRQFPVNMQCPHCHASIQTATRHEAGTCTWLSCVGLCVIGCDLGCCLIPFCVDDCQDVIHECPNCHSIVGRFNRL